MSDQMSDQLDEDGGEPVDERPEANPLNRSANPDAQALRGRLGGAHGYEGSGVMGPFVVWMCMRLPVLGNGIRCRCRVADVEDSHGITRSRGAPEPARLFRRTYT